MMHILEWHLPIFLTCCNSVAAHLASARNCSCCLIGKRPGRVRRGLFFIARDLHAACSRPASYLAG